MELLSYAFDSRCNFRFKKCKFRFEDLEFVFYSGNKDHCEVVQVINDERKKREQIFQIINKFLNSFSWANHCSFGYRGYCAYGLRDKIDLMKIEPRIIFPRSDRSLVVDFETIINIPTNELEIALSLYNEASFTQNIFYKFFCFWKILSIRYPNRTKESASNFINRMIQTKKVYMDKFINDLLKKQINVGKHLYDHFRCAIAHITRSPVKLSFNEDDFREVSIACHSIEHFVKYFIDKELGLPRHCDKIDILEFLE